MQGIQNIDHSPMLSNQQTVSHQPDRFIIDFKGVFPQFTPDNNPQMVINHKVILMDPHVALEFFKTLETNIKRFEEKFGKIKPPKALEIAKKDRDKKAKGKKKKSSSSKPSYMG